MARSTGQTDDGKTIQIERDVAYLDALRKRNESAPTQAD
jgi:hypothetical protein